MFAWFFLSALYLQLVLGYSPLQVGLAFLPANLIMGAFSLGLSAKLVMRFGIRAPLAVGLRPRRRSGCCSSSRAPVDGTLRRRRAARHDPARHRRRHGLQPGAAGGDERRRAERGRPRLRRGQHLVHDGRRARPGGPGQPRRVAHATACAPSGDGPLDALNGGYHAGLPRRRASSRSPRRDRRHAAARDRGRARARRPRPSRPSELAGVQ